MPYQTAVEYFDQLARSITDTQITNQLGSALSLNDGSQEAVKLILKAGTYGKIIVIGNGGSAAIASHVQNDLCKAVGVKAMVLTETSLFTALINDHSYAEAYEKQVQMWAAADDLLLAISSSGKSENILRAAHAAAERHCTVITFSGFKPENPLRKMGTLNFYVPSSHYGFVELSHTSQLHFLTDSAAEQREAFVQKSSMQAI
jgi:D-sedoheptulose 7-phosphate isomerase